MAARLGERIPTQVAGRDLKCGDAELVLLCVPDRAIAEVAAAIPPGPWVGHTSGACRLEALSPHERRFSLHPLQTFTLDRGPEDSPPAGRVAVFRDPFGHRWFLNQPSS